MKKKYGHITYLILTGFILPVFKIVYKFYSLKKIFYYNSYVYLHFELYFTRQLIIMLFFYFFVLLPIFLPLKFTCFVGLELYCI